MSTKVMSPVLKWAGGKTQLLEELMSKVPQTYNTYFEPFIGAGAFFLSLKPKSAVINDTNEQLINLYQQLKHSPSEIISIVSSLDEVACDKNYYYKIRERYNQKITSKELDPECAALMIWINKHCFNGLYRVNSQGFFNVPYNNKVTGKSLDKDNVEAISRFLKEQNVTILCSDFENACKKVSPGDFVYLDSPYVPESSSANFTDYTKTGFSYEDHDRLADLFVRLDKLGAYVMLSNNDVPLVRELYREYNIEPLEVKRLINRNAAKRSGKEVIVTNYQ
ncbi:DNA adenine methylase [Turicimonas muris]|uniref:DNA adenine methylase n=1 Tax=Turicimonas muris TaxID=1796652 RepID=UPI00249452D2|nr:DNA adenine methylase [Turicimonas muris]